MRKVSEVEEQIALFQWVAATETRCSELRLLFHVPNERKCTPAQGAKLKRMGVKSGVPDLCLPVARKGYHGLWIELKSQKGRVSDRQKEWIESLKQEGYLATVCYGAREAIEVLGKYLDV